MPTRSGGGAFVKGGLGCLALAIFLGVCVAATGGSFYIDGGGVIMLFVIGGGIGLIAWGIYRKGQRDAGEPPTRRPYDDI